MGLTRKAKILLGGVAAALVVVVVIVPLVVFGGRQSTDAEGRERLTNIDLSLQRSVQKMLDLVEQVEAQASRRVARDVNMMDLRDLEESVSQLSRSLSDFAEMLNESGFSNIIARFQQDLQKYDQILTEIRNNHLKIDSEILEKIKSQEKSFSDDESDLFKIENISRAQSVLAAPVIMAMGVASNKTKELLKEEEDADAAAVPVTQDNDTVIVIPANETVAADITEITSVNVVTETVASDGSGDDDTTAEPDDREEKTSVNTNDHDQLRGKYDLNRSQESNESSDEESDEDSSEESLFDTPIQTPNLSDVE